MVKVLIPWPPGTLDNWSWSPANSQPWSLPLVACSSEYDPISFTIVCNKCFEAWKSKRTALAVYPSQFLQLQSNVCSLILFEPQSQFRRTYLLEVVDLKNTLRVTVGQRRSRIMMTWFSCERMYCMSCFEYKGLLSLLIFIFLVLLLLITLIVFRVAFVEGRVKIAPDLCFSST